MLPANTARQLVQEAYSTILTPAFFGRVETYLDKRIEMAARNGAYTITIQTDIDIKDVARLPTKELRVAALSVIYSRLSTAGYVMNSNDMTHKNEWAISWSVSPSAL